MGGEWPIMSLRESGITLIDCDHRTPPAAASGYPYVAIPQIKQGRIDLADVRRITPVHFADWTRKANPQPFDVVLSRRCNPGETAFVPPGLQFAVGQNLILLRADGRRVEPRFLRWLVRGPAWWEQVQKFLNVGAVFDSLRCGDVPNFELPIPPLAEQRAIANILGTLDDKIELNRQTNETLEAMARALFKSWFVDFDPVRAKAEGRQPRGMDAETASLFPSELVESELGEIPTGWRAVPFMDFAELLSGGTPKTSVPEYWNGDIKWASAKDVSQCGSFFLVDTERMISREGLQHSATKMIPAGSVVVVARGATCGRFTVLAETMAMNQTCYALSPRVPEARWYLRFLSEQLLVRLVAQAHGSVFDTITTGTFERAQTLDPGPQALEQFETAMTPIVERIRQLHYEDKTLTRLRDALLPRLLSGELSVPDAARVLEAQA
jgi:type I restriction enzyme, S subunit